MVRYVSETERAIVEHARNRPNETWLKFGEAEYDWQEVLGRIFAFGNSLTSVGIGPGSTVGILAGNSAEFLWSYLGSLTVGMQVVPMNTKQRGNTLRHVIDDSELDVLIHDHDVCSALTSIADESSLARLRVSLSDCGCESAVAYNDFVSGASESTPSAALPAPPPAVAMLYTSGTTGPPKGIKLPVGYEDYLEPLWRACGVKRGETLHTALPLYHGNALLVSTLGSIRLGAKLAVSERFSVSRYWEECQRFDAVSTSLMSTMIPRLLDWPGEDVANAIRVALTVGCPPELWKRFEARFGLRIVEWYGMSDAPGNLVNEEGVVGSVGRPAGGAQFRVVDEDGAAKDEGEPGQLIFRTPDGAVTSYKGLADATREAWDDGWFHSGDLAREVEGNFYYLGRIKDSLRRKGENVSPWEIESIVSQHSSVAECAAYAIPGRFGDDEIMVAVVPAGDDFDPQAVLRWSAPRMAEYAVPRFLRVCASLPKTATEKVQYATLRGEGVVAGSVDFSEIDLSGCDSNV